MMTHEDVVIMVEDFAKFHCWSPGRISELKSVSSKHGGVPDLILWKQSEAIRAIEVKSENCNRDEIRRGIGQCAYYLLYDFYPYLVLPESRVEEVLPVFGKLKVIGLLSYDSRKTLRVEYGKRFTLVT